MTLGVAVVVALVGAMAMVLVVRPGTVARAEKPAAGSSSKPAPDSDPASASSVGQASQASCPTHATHTQFEPTSARIGPLDATYDVVRVRRVDGAIGAPPLTERGKHLVGWDDAVEPGARHGTVIVDAHTWPDGSALGNALMRSLHEGDVVQVSRGEDTVCYRITSRRSYPVARVPMAKIADRYGKPRLAIIVCSGKRVGPGDWLRRTVWIAARA